MSNLILILNHKINFFHVYASKIFDMEEQIKYENMYSGGCANET